MSLIGYVIINCNFCMKTFRIYLVKHYTIQTYEGEAVHLHAFLKSAIRVYEGYTLTSIPGGFIPC